jgi:hypothetical protein
MEHAAVRYTGISEDQLKSELVLNADSLAIATWLRLVVHAGTIERETIPYAPTNDRAWQVNCAVSLSDIDHAIRSKLCAWRAGGLWVWGFDHRGSEP